MKTNHKTAWGRALLTALLVLALCAGMSFAAGAAEGDVAINAANFPDAVFRTYIEENFDTNGDNTLSAEERAAVTKIDVSYLGTASLCGIEHFTQLENLYCNYNGLTSLDVSANTNLTLLMCNNNLLTELDLSQNTALSMINCSGNNLTSLDVSANTNLSEIYCSNNLLTELDLSQNTALLVIIFENNRLTHLDLSANTALLGGGGNQAFEITAEGRTHTMPEGFDSGKVTYVYGGTFSGRVLTVDEGSEQVEYEYSVNDSGHLLYVTLSFPALHTHAESGICKCGKLLLNEKNFPDATFRAYIQKTFDIDDDNMLSAEERGAVTQITVPLKQITDLTGVNYFTNLNGLFCHDNLLTSLDVSGCVSLVAIECYDNSLTELILPQGTALAKISCAGNNLTHLDVSGVKGLNELNCQYNRLTHLDLSQNTELSTFMGEQSFDITVNSFDGAAWTYEAPEGFDAGKVGDLAGGTFAGRVLTLSTNAPIENSTLVTYTYDTGRTGKTMSVCLFVENAHLHADTGMCSCGAGVRINEQNFPDAIFRAYIQENFDDGDGFLTAEELAAVTKIDVDNMGISSLAGISYFTNLTHLYCSNNNLTSLDVSALTKLELLSCYYNQLTVLDLRSNTALKNISCEYNYLVSLDLSQNTELIDAQVTTQNDIDITLSADEAKFDFSTIDPLFDSSRVTVQSQVVFDGPIMLGADFDGSVRLNYDTGYDTKFIMIDINVDNPHTHTKRADNTCACGTVYQSAFSDSAFKKYIRDTYFNGAEADVLTPAQIATVTSIDLTSVEGVAEFTGIEYFTSLVTLIAPNQSITSLDLSGLAKLQTVNLSGSAGLTSLNLAGCTALTTLNVSNCASLGTLDVSSLAALTTLDVSSTQISALNLSANTALTTLNVDGTKLATLDLSGVSGDVALTGQSAVTITACGTGYVNMAQFGDTAKITHATNGVLGADGWLKLNADTTSFTYHYATGNGETALIVNVSITVNGEEHNYTAQNVPSGDTHHYTQACQTCRAGDESHTAEHTYGEGHVCEDCAHQCTHGGTDSATGICGFCQKQFALSVNLGGSNPTFFYFDTFAEVLADTNIGTIYTIKLYTDVAVDQALTFTGKNIRLDLNGNTITFGAGISGAYWTIDGGQFYIENSNEAKTGKITNVSGNNNLGIEFMNGAIVNMYDITIEFSSSYAFTISGGARFVHNTGTVKNPIYISGGTYELTGGTIDVATDCAFYVNPASGDGSNTLNIYGGTVSVNDTAGNGGLFDAELNHIDFLTISGGTFINKAEGKLFGIDLNKDDGSIVVIGGTFESGIRANEELGLSALLTTGFAFFSNVNENAGEPVPRVEGRYALSVNVTVAKCNEHAGGTAYCGELAICVYCGAGHGAYDPDMHKDADDNGLCDLCPEYAFVGAGTESDPYIITSLEELRTVGTATVNEKNYIKLGGNINGNSITPIEITAPFELDLDICKLSFDAELQIKNVTGAIKNGTLEVNVSVFGADGNLSMYNMTGIKTVCAYNGGNIDVTSCELNAICIAGDGGTVTATAARIIPTSGGIFTIYSGEHNSNATLVLDGATYTESLADTHWPHDLAGVNRYIPNNDGTHNILFSCCDTVKTANFACYFDSDFDCTTADICQACGCEVVPAQTAHTLVIVRNKNDTHHMLKCTVGDCRHEEDAEHVYKEIIRSDYMVSAANCTQKAVYYKSCECGHKGTETFEGGELDPGWHWGQAGKKFLSNGDGTHRGVWDCCDATIIASISCSTIYDYDCTTPDLCQVCGYDMVPAQAAHDFSYYVFDEKQHWLMCQNARNNTCHATSGDKEDCADATGDFKCDVCDRDLTEFVEFNISLGQDIKVNYYIYALSFTTLEMRFSVNGYTKTVQGVPDGGQYKFTFDGVAPHWIGDTITAEILIDGKVAKTNDYSVKEYLNELKNRTAPSFGMSEEKYNAMITLVNDLLVYGGAAQEYTGHKTNLLASSGITGTQFADVTATDTTVQNGKVTFTSATLFFDSVNRLKFKFTASDIANVAFKVQVNGGEAADIGYVSNGDGTYTITTGAIYAYCFDDVYTVTAYVGGEADAVLTYSVKSYVYAKQGEAGNIAALVKATYNYGLSAKAYREFN